MHKQAFLPPPPPTLPWTRYLKMSAIEMPDDGQQLNNPCFLILDPIAFWIETTGGSGG